MTNNQIHAQRKDKASLLAALKSAGAAVRGSAISCPFHEDDHPSGSIHQDDAGIWRFKCHTDGCNFAGDVWDVRAKIAGRDVEDLLRDELFEPVVATRGSRRRSPPS